MQRAAKRITLIPTAHKSAVSRKLIYPPAGGGWIFEIAGCFMRRAAKYRFAHVKPYSPKKMLLALLLCFVLGAAGVHRFYVGKNKTGILWLVTGGLLGVGILVDYVRIAAGRFTDQDGLRLAL